MKIRLMGAKLFHANRRRHGRTWIDWQTWRSDSRFLQIYECSFKKGKN